MESNRLLQSRLYNKRVDRLSMHIIYIILYGYTTTPVLIKLTYRCQCACARVSVQYLLLVAMNHRDPYTHSNIISILMRMFVRLHKLTIIHARRCAARLCARRISPRNLVEDSTMWNSRWAEHRTCLPSFIVCVYIYIHTSLLRFSLRFFPLSFSLFQFRFACELPLLKPLLLLARYIHVQQPSELPVSHSR